ncbi:hypothetical protein KUCAC02_021840, partial [Chaenocephalus aceratus]
SEIKSSMHSLQGLCERLQALWSLANVFLRGATSSPTEDDAEGGRRSSGEPGCSRSHAGCHFISSILLDYTSRVQVCLLPARHNLGCLLAYSALHLPASCSLLALWRAGAFMLPEPVLSYTGLQEQPFSSEKDPKADEMTAATLPESVRPSGFITRIPPSVG